MTLEHPEEKAPQPTDDDRGRKLGPEQIAQLRDALWEHHLGRDPKGDRLADVVQDLLREIGGRP